MGESEGRAAELAAREAKAALTAMRALGRGGLAPCSAKEVATVALWLQVERGLCSERALQAAAHAFGEARSNTRGSRKKITSEARAILQFGVTETVLTRHPNETADARLRRLADAVGALSLRQVTQARALTLAGVRGGRPTSGGRGAYAAVERLVKEAQDGDSQAWSELSAIRNLMVSADRPAHTAGRRGASR